MKIEGGNFNRTPSWKILASFNQNIFPQRDSQDSITFYIEIKKSKLDKILSVAEFAGY